MWGGGGGEEVVGGGGRWGGGDEIRGRKEKTIKMFTTTMVKRCVNIPSL